MSARSNARYVGMLLVAGIAPGANAVELSPGPVGTTAQISTTVSLPAFIDASRLADMQAAWRTRFSGGELVAAPVVKAISDPEAGTINEARQTLTRAEQVTFEAVAVRERAEELSRRFAVDTAAESAVAANAGPAPASAESVVTETVAVHADTAPASDALAVSSEVAPDAPALIQKAVATTTVKPKNDMAPASMLGGPAVEEAPAEVAPVIEDMATAPAPRTGTKKAAAGSQQARRTAQTASTAEPPTLFGIFSSWGSSSEEPATSPHEKSTSQEMPTEIRSFGWTQ